MDKDKYIGRLLDNRYEILEVIGTGGMAVVYKARCHRLNRLVAIKILKDDLSQDSEFRRRFHTESQAVAMLSHPNIMSVYDVSTTDEADYIVMELIDGITLKQYMEKKGVLNWKETLHFAMLIAKALEHAHSRGIVHRDIKPHNVMVLKNGSVKVTDFGIARIMSKSNTLTKEALGSVHYISPEQAKGGRVDNRSDLYSLAVVMYEMMTGRPPYDGESPVSVAIQHINGGAAMPSTLNPNIPGGLEQIIMKTMEVDPAKRYASATAMLYDMEEFRKNPTMLFDFSDTPVDDAVRVQNVAAPAAKPAAPARSQAERAVNARQRAAQPTDGRQRAAQSGAQRRSGQTYPDRQSQTDSAQARAKREAARRERQEQEESRIRVVTIAVIACSLVAVIAIVIFLAMLLGGAGGDVTLIPAPNLIGQPYAELDRSQYEDFRITLGEYRYSDEYAEGLIMDQTPDPDTQVGIGSEIKVYVSQGPELEELPAMENLSDTTEQAATEWLDSLKGDLKILPKTENHDTIKEGRVTRTEPAAGEPLVRGQTVTVWISTGPELREEYVPNVIGLPLDRAITTLKNSGFENYDVEREESLEDKDQVLRLSVEVSKKLDVTTDIIIYVSEGFIKKVMPNVLGKTYEAAEKELNALGFHNVTQTVQESTEPAGTVLSQSTAAGTEYDTTTSIVLTVSEGVVRKLVPKVVGKTFEEARTELNNAGFANVTPETVESNLPKGQVVSQSVQADTKADANQQIVLQISSGPAVVKTVTVTLPTDLEAAYQLTIMHQGQTAVEMTIQPGTPSITIQLTGRGQSEYEVYIDGVAYKTEKVDFDS